MSATFGWGAPPARSRVDPTRQSAHIYNGGGIAIIALSILALALPAAFADEPAAMNRYAYVLESVNVARVGAGLDAVDIGSNPAPQRHAEEMLANCYTSPWSMDGLKPHMRYVLAGGEQRMHGVAYGPNYCITEPDGYGPISLASEIDDAMAVLLNDTGSSAILLDPYNARLSVGVARDEYNMQLALSFEYDFIDWKDVWMHNGKLVVSGTLKDDRFPDAHMRNLRVSLYYDPPPTNLTAGQLQRTYCYGEGTRVTLVVPSWITRSYMAVPAAPSTCVDPHDYPPDIPTATSPRAALLLAEAARIESTMYESVCLPGKGCFLVSSEIDALSTAYAHSMCNDEGCFLVGPGIRVPARYVSSSQVTFTEADVWHVLEGGMFNVQADIAGPLSRHGPGFYTVILDGYVGNIRQTLGAYTLPHGMEFGAIQYGNSNETGPTGD